MLQLKYDPNQNRITDFYNMADKVQIIINSSPRLVSAFQFSTICADRSFQSENNDKATFHSFFGKLVQNAYRNVDKSIPQARRYDVIVKKFAMLLLLYSGPMHSILASLILRRVYTYQTSSFLTRRPKMRERLYSSSNNVSFVVVPLL